MNELYKVAMPGDMNEVTAIFRDGYAMTRDEDAVNDMQCPEVRMQWQRRML